MSEGAPLLHGGAAINDDEDRGGGGNFVTRRVHAAQQSVHNLVHGIRHMTADDVKHWLRTKLTWANLQVTVLLVVLIASLSIDYVLYIRLAYNMVNYEWYLGSVVITMSFLAISVPVVYFKFIFTNHITPAMTAVPKRYFLILGTCDALANILSTIPAPHLKPSFQLVLSQLIIPINMVTAFVFLRTRYRVLHYLGMLGVIAGVVVAALPDLRGGSGRLLGQLPWMGMFVLSNVPGAASNVYKEWGLKGLDLDVWYFNAWVAIFQLVFGVLTAPMVFAKPLLGDAYVKPADFFQYLGDATGCFLGYDAKPGDKCEGTVYIFLVYMFFNITFNIVLLLVFKHGSATLAMIASASRVVLSDLLFQLRFLAGTATITLNMYDYIALVVVVTSILLYRIQREREAGEAKKPDGDAASDPLIAGDPDAAGDEPSKHRSALPSFTMINPAVADVDDLAVIDGGERVVPRPRNQAQIRNDFFLRIGILKPPPAAGSASAALGTV